MLQNPNKAIVWRDVLQSSSRKAWVAEKWLDIRRTFQLLRKDGDTGSEAGVSKISSGCAWLSGEILARDYGKICIGWGEVGGGKRDSGALIVLYFCKIIIIMWLFSYSLLRQGVFSPDVFPMILFHFSLMFGSFPSKSKLCAENVLLTHKNHFGSQILQYRPPH